MLINKMTFLWKTATINQFSLDLSGLSNPVTQLPPVVTFRRLSLIFLDSKFTGLIGLMDAERLTMFFANPNSFVITRRIHFRLIMMCISTVLHIVFHDDNRHVADDARS